MPTDEPNNLSGYLLEWPSRPVQRSDFLRCDRLTFGGNITDSHWETYVFKSPIPLNQENTDFISGPYIYPIVCRRSGPRVLVLSSHRRIVEHLLSNGFNGTFTPSLRRVSIAVDDLVRALVNRPTVFVLSFVHARAPAFGTALRAVSFYGEDLADASLFRESIMFFNFATCGLRHAVGGTELVRLGGDGAVSFNYSREQRVLEVEDVLRFLSKQGYLSTEIVPGSP